MILNFTPAQKVLQSEASVLGKVTSIEKETIEAEAYKGAPNKLVYTIAVIKIERAFQEAKGLTHIKVGFHAPVAEIRPAGSGAGARPPGFQNLQSISLKADQEGVFFLHRHPTENFYILRPGFTPLYKTDVKYKEELAQVSAVSATIADPLLALKAKNADDRLAAAATLITNYRSLNRPAPFGSEQVPIPAEESKLILKTIIEADWDKFKTDPTLNPINCMNMLGVYPGALGIPQYKPTPGDTNPAESYRKWYRAEITKWYETQGSKFEIKKLVPKTMK